VRLTPGTRLGPYEVLSTLGTGGMAEVYRARDTRLGRDIALKVVNEALAGNPELVRRFEKEARLAGSLNHPNLVAVYDVGLHDGVPYFITELLHGDSLRHRLSRGRIPVDSALDWAAQLAQGLAAAHARGIVHRDVKPENVFLTSDGHVKLLDFGIAKLAEGTRAEGPHGILDETVTPTGGGTQTGAILGTPAYMAPEQVRGEHVDARTDIFSLGAVLHEMLSGRRPFAGDSLVESGHAILHDEPPPLPDVPPFLAQLVRRCLAKDPEARLQSARDLAFALETLRPDVEPRPASRRGAFRSILRRPWWVLALMAVLVAAVVIARLRPSHAPALPPTVERVTFRPVAWPRIARFTPDGRVVFTVRQGGTEELFERNLASASLQPLGLQNMVLAATSSTGELAVFLTSHPFVPGEAFSATLARVPGGGGTPQPVAEDVVSADWSPSGELAIVRTAGTRFSLEFPIGKTLFQTMRPALIGNVRVSPRGDLLAFTHHPKGGFGTGGEVVIIDLEGRKRQVSRRWPRATGLAWSPRNEVWFAAGDDVANQLQAMPLTGSERTVYTSLAPIIVHDIAADGSVLIGQGFREFDIIFLGEGAANPRSLGWYDSNGSPRLSADGRLVLFSAWGIRRERGERVALLRKTSGAPPQNLGEGWGLDLSPDGRWALLASADGLTLVATGTGTRKNVPLPGLEIRTTRFLGSTSRAVSIARSSTDSGFRLYSIDLDRSSATPLSEPMKGLGELLDVLEISPDNQWAATRVAVDEKYAPVLHPLSGGKPVPLTGLGPNVRPVGWASKNELWLARVDQADPSVVGLIRFDVSRRVAVEERTIGSGGPEFVGDLHLTSDGKNIVFDQLRLAGHLYVIRGMASAR
jgi:eukaryotic-like serine/threonine-protein kinase